MLVDQELQKIHERVRGVIRIVTNVMTPEGRKIMAAWDHYSPEDKEPTHCLVSGSTVEEVIRKVVSLEDDFQETGR